MTKLPKRLEKVIEQKAESLEDMSCFNEADVCRTYGTDIAIEVLKEAQKLVEALEKCRIIKVIGPTGEVSFESQVAVDALSGWNAFVEGE